MKRRSDPYRPLSIVSEIVRAFSLGLLINKKLKIKFNNFEERITISKVLIN